LVSSQFFLARRVHTKRIRIRARSLRLGTPPQARRARTASSVRDETPSFRQTADPALSTDGTVRTNAVAISAFVFPATTRDGQPHFSCGQETDVERCAALIRPIHFLRHRTARCMTPLSRR